MLYTKVLVGFVDWKLLLAPTSITKIDILEMIPEIILVINWSEVMYKCVFILYKETNECNDT